MPTWLRTWSRSIIQSLSTLLDHLASHLTSRLPLPHDQPISPPDDIAVREGENLAIENSLRFIHRLNEILNCERQALDDWVLVFEDALRVSLERLFVLDHKNAIGHIEMLRNQLVHKWGQARVEADQEGNMEHAKVIARAISAINSIFDHVLRYPPNRGNNPR